jgi:hypothetical protein
MCLFVLLLNVHSYLFDPPGKLVAVFALGFAYWCAFVYANIGEIVG